MALSAETISIQAPIPGKDVVGIEIPNETVDTIYLRELLDDKLFKDSASPLTIALGKDIVGKPFITDLKNYHIYLLQERREAEKVSVLMR